MLHRFNNVIESNHFQLLDYLVHGFQTEFLQDAMNLRLDGAQGNEPGLRYLAGIHALVQALKHLKFAVGQLRKHVQRIQKAYLLFLDTFQLDDDLLGILGS